MNPFDQLARSPVAAVLAARPAATAVFNQLRMACVGCAVAPFCTVAGAAAEFAVPLDALLARLVWTAPGVDSAESPR